MNGSLEIPRTSFSRVVIFAVLATWSLGAFSGCARSEKYTKLRVTDYRGATISEYTARGGIRPVEGGYRINAVERESGPPYRMLSKYPDGWKTTVLGPRISHWRAEKPDWLAEREADEE